MMTDIIKQALEELRSAYNLIHGPEVWLAFPWLCLISAVVGFIVFDKWEDDDDR